MVATDGQRLTLGDTTLTLYLTPGHTPGTISTLIPVKDRGMPHVVAEWGGTGFNFTLSPDKPERYWFETYIDVGRALPRRSPRKAGADALIARITPTSTGRKRSSRQLRHARPAIRIPTSSALPVSGDI